MKKTDASSQPDSTLRRFMRPLVKMTGTLLASSYLGFCRTPYSPPDSSQQDAATQDAPATTDTSTADTSTADGE